MTSVRTSFVFAPEKEFKKMGNNLWIAPPPGSYFSSTAARQTSPIYTTGSKKWDVTAYGQYAGSWDWTFMLDYQYLEPLVLAFDGVAINDRNKIIKWKHKDEAGYGYNDYVGKDTDYNLFFFTKENNSKPPSFTVRRKILHRIVGGPNDEMVELRGCVVNSISFSRSSSTSQYQVQMSGFYATEEMVLGELEKTDYWAYDGQLVEYSCVRLYGLFDGKTLSDQVAANTDSVSITITNGTNPVYNTCTPFAGQYYEDRVKFQISTSCYSTDPETYKTRLYSGGHDHTARKPLSKGLKPLKKMEIISFDGEMVDMPNEDATTVITQSYSKSKNRLSFIAEDLVIKSARWVNGDGSKLTDSISSTDCKNITLMVARTPKDGEPDPLFKNIIHSSSPVTPTDSST